MKTLRNLLVSLLTAAMAVVSFPFNVRADDARSGFAPGVPSARTH